MIVIIIFIKEVMKNLILKIDGMACNMCESHVNAIVRDALNTSKVKSNYKKGTCTVTAESFSIDETERLTAALNAKGYRVLDMKTEEAKPGLISRLFGR